MPQLGTIDHINFCQYMIDTVRSNAARNRWLRLQEESEYQAYKSGTLAKRKDSNLA